MKLYGYWRSSSAWRVRIGLAWKGAAYELSPVHLVRDGGEQHRPEYRAVNPMEEVPVLEVTIDGQLRRIGQSMAILDLLELAFPDPALLPARPFERARARQLAEIVNAGTQPLQNLGVLQRVKALGGDEAEWARHYIARGLGAIEALAAETPGQFLVGNTVSIADVYLIPQLYNARRFGVDLQAYPRLLAVEATCVALPPFSDTHPDRQPDAPGPS
jgi:maleylpyruvate isomerase